MDSSRLIQAAPIIAAQSENPAVMGCKNEIGSEIKSLFVKINVGAERHVVSAQVDAGGRDQFREHLSFQNSAGGEFGPILHQPNRFRHPNRFTREADALWWKQPPDQRVRQQVAFAPQDAAEEILWLERRDHVRTRWV
jgi:hypothetical protein